jgi:hypothetical protein
MMSPRIRAISAALRRNAQVIVRDIGGSAGVGLIVYGVGTFSVGLAMITAGGIMVAVTFKLARNA